MLAVALVAFSLFNFVGDPDQQHGRPGHAARRRAALRQSLGLNDPVPVQFAHFVAHACAGDFGLSYRMAQPVGELIMTRLPATLELSFVAALFALVVGVPMGVYTGLLSATWPSRAAPAVSLIGISLPTFLIGILLILHLCRGARLAAVVRARRGGAISACWSTGFLTLSAA